MCTYQTEKSTDYEETEKAKVKTNVMFVFVRVGANESIELLLDLLDAS